MTSNFNKQTYISSITSFPTKTVFNVGLRPQGCSGSLLLLGDTSNDNITQIYIAAIAINQMELLKTLLSDMLMWCLIVLTLGVSFHGIT